MAYELTARRRPHATADGYDWLVSVSPDSGSTRQLHLVHGERSSWPQRVREYGITGLDTLGFLHPEERMLFALDCDF
jgi:hypothetical protein